MTMPLGAQDEQDTSAARAGADMSGKRELPAPGLGLEMLISQLTPTGALTWRALPLELPWTQPPGGGQPTRRPNDAVLNELLEGAGVKDPAAREYILAGPFTEVMVHSSKELARNQGLPARAIEVAAEHDISGSELADIATRVGLTDHELPLPGQPGTVTGDPRGGRRYLNEGRRLLGALGVWPWAHVESWSRTRRWWREETVFEALRSWHDKAWMRAAEHLAYNARARYGNTTSRVISVEEYHACRDFRSRLEQLGGERAERAAASGES